MLSKRKFYRQLGLDSINEERLLTFLSLLHLAVIQLNAKAHFFCRISLKDKTFT